jgi:hypothetical protein
MLMFAVGFVIAILLNLGIGWLVLLAANEDTLSSADGEPPAGPVRLSSRYPRLANRAG